MRGECSSVCVVIFMRSKCSNMCVVIFMRSNLCSNCLLGVREELAHSVADARLLAAYLVLPGPAQVR